MTPLRGPSVTGVPARLGAPAALTGGAQGRPGRCVARAGSGLARVGVPCLAVLGVPRGGVVLRLWLGGCGAAGSGALVAFCHNLPCPVLGHDAHARLPVLAAIWWSMVAMADVSRLGASGCLASTRAQSRQAYAMEPPVARWGMGMVSLRR